MDFNEYRKLAMGSIHLLMLELLTPVLDVVKNYDLNVCVDTDGGNELCAWTKDTNGAAVAFLIYVEGDLSEDFDVYEACGHSDVREDEGELPIASTDIDDNLFPLCYGCIADVLGAIPDLVDYIAELIEKPSGNVIIGDFTTH